MLRMCPACLPRAISALGNVFVSVSLPMAVTKCTDKKRGEKIFQLTVQGSGPSWQASSAGGAGVSCLQPENKVANPCCVQLGSSFIQFRSQPYRDSPSQACPEAKQPSLVLTPVNLISEFKTCSVDNQHYPSLCSWSRISPSPRGANV